MPVGTKVNKKMAMDFLSHFGELHNFFCIHPKRGANSRVRTRGPFWGTIQENWERLVKLNEQGYGVFFATNDVGGKDRLVVNVKSCRCIFQEDDGDWQGKLPLQPSIVIRSSPGHYHRYWMLNEDEPLSVDEFYACMRRMVNDYGSDRGCCDPTRLLRIPGFYHTKNPQSPHLVSIVKISETTYSRDKILSSFPDVPGAGGKVNWNGDARPKTWSYTGDGREWADDRHALIEDLVYIIRSIYNISPDCSYQEWVTVGMVLKGLMGDRTYPFEVWDRWSSFSTKYKEAGGTKGLYMKWQSFSNKLVPGAVGLGSLLTIVKRSGVVADGDFDEEVTVADAPGIDEMLSDIHDYKLEVLNDHFGMHVLSNKARVVCRQLAGGVYSTQFWETSTFHSMLANCNCPVPTGKDKEGNRIWEFKKLSKVWEAHYGRRNIDDILPLPRRPLDESRGALMADGNDNNLMYSYTGLTSAPRKGVCEAYLNHIYNVWCDKNKEAYDYVIRWFARMFQYPYEPAGTALVVVGGQGAGKGIIMEPLVRLLGSGAIVCTSSDSFTGRFNWHLFNKVLVYGNEATWGGTRKGVGALKALITDKYIMFEDKGVTAGQKPNVCHLVINSNESWVTHIDTDDRRHVVLRTNDRFVGNRRYFKKLADEISQGGIEAFAWMLLNEIDLTDWDFRDIPQGNESSRNLKFDHMLQSGDEFMTFWDNVIHTGDLRHRSERFNLRDGGFLPIKAILAIYEDTMSRGNGYGNRITISRMFSRKMEEILGVAKVKKRIGGEIVQGYNMPPLDKLEELFSENFF